MIDYDTIPAATMSGLVRYRDRHIPTGSFLRAVLCNNLRDAFGRADMNNTEAMQSIVAWCYNELPGNSWGSVEVVDAWLAPVPS